MTSRAIADIQRLVAAGESETLELKRSTAELRRAGESLCALLNGGGGQVVIGVAPDGKILGQQVSDSTRQLFGPDIVECQRDRWS